MTQNVTMPSGYDRPGTGRGLLDALNNRFLLHLLVNKDLRVRYRGSALGMLWSYVKPAVQFLVFYFAVGVFLGMERVVHNFAVYLFAGIIAINLFNEAFGNATRSIVGNSALVKKIYMPRQLFSISAVWVAVVHFVPQLVVLVVGALVVGWRPGPLNLLAGVLGFLILVVLSLGLGLLFGALNVMMRDSENIVDLIAMVVSWTSPVLYHWQNVTTVLGTGRGWTLYMLNPLTPIVELFHYCFWAPTSGVEYLEPPGMWLFVATSALTSILILVLGEGLFRRLDGRFAQEL
ncbi:ABC transporter permease [Propioniciclava sp. MC1683]|uniref:ABC transporter permease n=1 Tax=Propioniciclava sp. MC1683 TaxID=2760309 RepID=UPI002815F0BF|nr:ABC transporter permease [Propioniciclava sp. MC1683]